MADPTLLTVEQFDTMPEVRWRGERPPKRFKILMPNGEWCIAVYSSERGMYQLVDYELKRIERLPASVHQTSEV
jgi:hypothetical protein